MNDMAIKVKNLKKSFKATEVLNGVDFEVKRGEIFALLGSNGAGKTTIVHRPYARIDWKILGMW